MSSFGRSSALAALLGAMLALLPMSAASGATATPEASESTALMNAMKPAHFAEPLVAARPTSASEDQALLQALQAYADRANPEDQGRLVAFLSAYPHSGWAPTLWTNLGLSYLHYGYYSRALDAWQKAWDEGKDIADGDVKAEVDRAVGELARLEASLGRNDDLAALFNDIGKRPITGSATEAIQTAREELDLASNDARHLFNCGPFALSAVLTTEGFKPEQVSFLQLYRPSANGTSLAELGEFADRASFGHQLIFRKPGQAVPVPSVVHLKVGHFAAIVGVANDRYHLKDPVFPTDDVWMSEAAIDAEASGYFLVPNELEGGANWRTVAQAEADTIWGKGPTSGTPPGVGPDLDPQANPAPSNSSGTPASPAPGFTPVAWRPGSPAPSTTPAPPAKGCGMCGYNILESTVSLTMADTPVGYTPPLGPSAAAQIIYNQRQDSQPAVFTFFNVSPKWTLNWLSYVIDDPSNPGASVARYMSGGSQYYYTGYTASTGLFTAQTNDGSRLALASQSPVTYRLQKGDGSAEVYAQSDGSTGYPRRVFLSEVIDPQGNTLTLNYDGQQRLVSLTDATGRQTSFSYGLASKPLLVTAITDPFGRSATLTYDSSGRLSSITDVIGITSSFTYDVNSLVNSMTTPYGTTSFSFTAPGTSGPPRFVDVTDPMGYHEREEWLEPAPIPSSDPTSTVPQGMPVTPYNAYLNYRSSFHWDKNAYVLAGCTPTGGCDYTKARDRHFYHQNGNINAKSMSIESVKYPLENRIWFDYDDQPTSYYSGSYTQPIATGRVLDDGTTQLSRASYDTGGYYKVTETVDPLGRTTSFAYSNHVDLAAISQTTAYGVQQTIAQFIYNTHHRPTYYTDAAGQTWTYAYNAAGQLTSATNSLGQTTTYQYNGTGDLTGIVNANSETAATFTYDSFDRIHTFTDSEGWTVTYDYDAADRVTKITYPDGTTDQYTYDKLDLASYRDRQGRLWTYAHDANRRLTSVTDPAGHQTLYGYNHEGQLTSLTDPKSNVTQWAYDVEGRLTGKTYPDSSTLTYTYENTTSRLMSVLDALGQTKEYSYALDNRLTGTSYIDAVNPTPNVSFAYDPYYPRLASMTDGTGTTTYSHVPVGSPGALQLAQENGPLPASAITYAYDQLGRLSSRSVAGAGAETFGYDSLGRLTSHASDLGSFTLAYLGQTGQITSRQLVGSTLATTWSYLPNSGDRRLSGIGNVGLLAGQYSTFGYVTTPEDFITSITENSDAATVYPPALAQTAIYNNLNQLTDLSGQALSWDADGNLLSDATRTYSWDAENRLIGIAYPGTPGKATSFTYDGFDRRIAITSTPAGGGSAVTTSYLWCGSAICQARDAGNTTMREYLAEGEYVPGATPETDYYGVDQIGSVRRVFASTSNAPAFSYDPYGVALQTTTPLTDFNFAGMFHNSDSGLDLTLYRAYDPAAGRWLSRDPLGELGYVVAAVNVGGGASDGGGVLRSVYYDPGLVSLTSAGPVNEAQNLVLADNSIAGQSGSNYGSTAELQLFGSWKIAGITRGSNLYAYALNDPITLTDPTGEITVKECLMVCLFCATIATGHPARPIVMPPLASPEIVITESPPKKK